MADHDSTNFHFREYKSDVPFSSCPPLLTLQWDCMSGTLPFETCKAGHLIHCSRLRQNLHIRTTPQLLVN